MYTILPLTDADLAACAAIYNHYIEHTCVTLEEAPMTPAEFGARARRIAADYPYLVAKAADGRVLGYAYLDRFNPRSAYRTTADLSIYVHPEHRADGVGTALLRSICAAAREQGIRNLISIITANNAPSLAFHKKHGFIPEGTLRRVAIKFGQVLDVCYLRLPLV